MKSTRGGILAALGGGVAAASAVAAVPAVALAEESAVGADILIPKPAELIPALIAFLIIFAILSKFVWPSVLEMMEKRQEKIRSDLESAERSRLEAAKKAAGYDEILADARRQADEIVAEARREATRERARLVAEAQAEVADMIAKAHGAVDSERHKAAEELSDSVVDLSVEIAEKIIGNDLSADDQRRLAERYLSEVSIQDVND